MNGFILLYQDICNNFIYCFVIFNIWKSHTHIFLIIFLERFLFNSLQPYLRIFSLFDINLFIFLLIMFLHQGKILSFMYKNSKLHQPLHYYPFQLQITSHCFHILSWIYHIHDDIWKSCFSEPHFELNTATSYTHWNCFYIQFFNPTF